MATSIHIGPNEAAATLAQLQSQYLYLQSSLSDTQISKEGMRDRLFQIEQSLVFNPPPDRSTKKKLKQNRWRTKKALEKCDNDELVYLDILRACKTNIESLSQLAMPTVATQVLPEMPPQSHPTAFMINPYELQMHYHIPEWDYSCSPNGWGAQMYPACPQIVLEPTYETCDTTPAMRNPIHNIMQPLIQYSSRLFKSRSLQGGKAELEKSLRPDAPSFHPVSFEPISYNISPPCTPRALSIDDRYRSVSPGTVIEWPGLDQAGEEPQRRYSQEAINIIMRRLSEPSKGKRRKR